MDSRVVPTSEQPGRFRVGLVGGGRGGAALLDYLHAWPGAEVTVVIDRRPEAPGLARARALGIATACDPLGVFAHPVDLVLEVTGDSAVLHDLLRARPPGVEVISAASLRFFWDLLETASERSRRLTALLGITRRHLALTGSPQLLPQIAREAADFLKADGAGIRIREDGGLALAASYGFSPDGLRRRVTVGESGTGWVVQHNRPLAIPDLPEDPRLVPEHRAVYRREGFRSMLAVPLRIEGRPIGALFVFTRARRDFSPADSEVLSGFADQAALAIQNARLFDAIERHRRTAECLAAAARRLTESLNRDEVGRRVAESARTLLRARAAVLYTVEADSGALHVLAACGLEGPSADPAAALRQSAEAARRAIEEQRPLATSDPLPGAIRASPEDEPRPAVLAVPLTVGTRVIGALAVEDDPGRGYDTEDRRLAQAFADQAGVALENSRLYAALEETLARLTASQQQLVQHERRRALGDLAAGLAHDFNNLLATILGRAEILLGLTTDPALQQGLETIRRAALAGARTVRRIQEFTQPPAMRPAEDLDVAALVRDAVELTRPRWEGDAQHRGIHYAVHVDADPVPPVAGIADELREVFLNLIANALEAMPGGGRLVVRVRADADQVVVTAEDTGCGMDEEVRRRAFEPFFTTKGPRRAGLGLSTAWRILTRHGGTISVESAPGAGSAFVVTLPRARPQAAASARVPPAARPRQPARVLVVEDEAAVRTVLRDMLQDAGYVVLEAAHGQDGLARFEAEPVDLVVTDLSMPGMSGWEVAAACRARDPRLPIGLITGWGDQLDAERVDRYRIAFVLAKPFAAAEVLRRVAQALGGGEPGRSPGAS